MRLKSALLVILIITVLISSFSTVLLTAPAAAAPRDSHMDSVQQRGSIVATVKVPRLNVRRIPRAQGSILGILSLNEQVTLVGRNVVSSWLQAETPFGIGWIDARYVSTNLSILLLPVTDDMIPPFATVTTAGRVVVRAGPFNEYPIVARVQIGTEMDVIGLHSQNTHVQVITPDGAVGWISLQLVRVTGDLTGLRFTDLEVLPLAKINTFRLRVRATPDTNAKSLGNVRLGQLYTILALDPTGQWAQIDTKFGRGWVLLSFVQVLGSLRVFQTDDH